MAAACPARHSAWVSGVLIVAVWCGIRVPGRAVKLGSSASAALNLTVALFIGTASTRARQPASAPGPSSRSVATGSALLITTGALIRSPPASSTPSSGTIRATGSPAATTAPASTAASCIRKLTIPIPPCT